MKRVSIIAAVLGTALIAGCGGESSLPEATGKGRVRAINTIATSPDIRFLIEERLIGTANYKTATSGTDYDDLDYTFNFEAILASGLERVASQFLDVAADKDYTFVISGALANPTITITETDVRTFDDGDTVFELRFGHFGTTLGDIDIYIDAPGVAPVLGQQITTLAVGDISDPLDYTSGDYEIIFTAAGDPTTVLFTSENFAPSPRTAFLIGAFDGDANDLGPVSVRAIPGQGTTSFLPDANLQPTIRFYNASMALGTVDIYNDDPATTAPVVSDHAYRDATADIPVISGENSLRYTPAGDTVTFLFEGTVTPFSAARTDYYLIGEADAYAPVALSPDRRPIETAVKFTVFHAAINHTAVDIYIEDAGMGITDSSPDFSLVPVGTPPIPRTLLNGSFDMYVTTPGEKTIIAGPLRLDVALGDVVNTIIFDNVDPATADIVVIPLP